METISLGPVPAEENCAQVGQPNYFTEAYRECRRYRDGLITKYPPPEGARIVVKSMAHDFGSYQEVCVIFNEANEVAARYAYELEGKLPSTWEELT